MSQGVECYSCLPKTAWPPTSSWAFSKNVSVILGYDIYNDQQLAGKNTFTTQVDINFPKVGS